MGRSLWNRTAAIAAACVVAGSVTSAASAAIVINIQQVGSNVVADISGSFDTSVDGQGSQSIGSGSYVWGGGPNTNGVYFDGVGTGSLGGFSWNGTVSSTPAGQTRWGSGAQSLTGATSTSSLTGFDRLWITWDHTNLVPTVRINDDYVSNTAISGSLTFANQTMVSLGLDNFGSYVFSFGTTTTDTVTVNLIAPSAIPGAGLAGLATLGLAGIVRRRRR